MTTVEITLPDALAKEAASAGLLRPERIADLLREQLRLERIERLNVARQKLASNPIPLMSAEEIQAEIEAYRLEQQRAVGS